MTAAILNKNTKSYSHWPVTIASESVDLDQSDGRKINSHLKIYTNMPYCSGSGLELLSYPGVSAVCHDSNVFLVLQVPLSMTLPPSKLIP